MAAGGKPDQPQLAGQKESQASHWWPGRGVQGVMGKQEVGVHMQSEKQAHMT